VDGLIAIDKPTGMTSHDVVARVRRITGQRAAGHTGTLDPDAAGLLVVCLGRAARLTRFIEEFPKEYEAEIVFGVSTHTGDASGRVTARSEAFRSLFARSWPRWASSWATSGKRRPWFRRFATRASVCTNSRVEASP